MNSSGQGCQGAQPSNILVQMKRCSSFLLNSKKKRRGYGKYLKKEQGVQHNLLQRITLQVICIMNPFLLKNLANFTGKRLLWSLFSIKFRPSGLIKKCFQHSTFRVKFAKFLRIPVSQNICERLLLSCIRFFYLLSLS